MEEILRKQRLKFIDFWVDSLDMLFYNKRAVKFIYFTEMVKKKVRVTCVFVSIASGSSGNCTYIGTEQSHILIDAGISCKRITDNLKKLDLKPSDLDGILLHMNIPIIFMEFVYCQRNLEFHFMVQKRHYKRLHN